MDTDRYDFRIEVLRPGVLRLTDPWWPHDCDDVDLVSMVWSHGRQGSGDSEDPALWDEWHRSPLRVVEDRVERWVTTEEWQKHRESLLDWLTRSRTALVMAPQLAEHMNLAETKDALAKHDATEPGWLPVNEDHCRAVLDYIRETGISIVNPAAPSEP